VPPRSRSGLGDVVRVRSFWPPGRIRRPVDVPRLVASSLASLALAALAAFAPDAARTLAELIPVARTDLLRALLSIVNVLASLTVLVALIVVVVDAIRFRRFALTSAALACVVAVPLGVGVALLAHLASSEALTLLLGEAHQSAGLPVTAVTALLVGADLHARRWWARSRLALAVGIGCAIGLGSLTLVSAAYALLVGTATGLAVRVTLGVLPARPPEDVVRSVLADAGWQLTALEPIQEAAGRVRYVGERADGQPVRVTVVDPDRRGVTFGRRVWRLLRLRTAAVGRPALSLRGLLEQQALCAALAAAADVAAPKVLALLSAGRALVLVEEPLAGEPLSGSAVDLPCATAAMRELRRLHDAGLAHGAISADSMLVLPDGRAGFAHLGAAQPVATDLQRELDVVAMLVLLASSVGPDDAVAALREGYGTDPMAETRLAALLQPLALPRKDRPPRRRHLLPELRTALTLGESGASHAPRLERLSTRTVVSIAAGTLAAYLLVGQLGQIDLLGALQKAQPGWLALALLGSAITYVGSALALQAFVPVALPLGTTAAVQLASSFVTLVTPPTVGQVGLNLRYLQKASVPVATAAAVVAVKEFVTVLVTVPLLLLCGWLSGVSASRLTLLPSGDVLFILGVVAAVLVLLMVVPTTRRLLLRRLQPLLRQTLPQLIAAASDPRRLLLAITGVLVLNAGYVLALDASLRAFGASLDLPTLVVVYLAASVLGSAAPTPGGLGAVEAALVGGLTAVGVPVAAALPAVLAFRTATFWLPAPLGYLAMLGLQRRGRL
jgi:uncharacterized protein (TIRG00374 family)